MFTTNGDHTPHPPNPGPDPPVPDPPEPDPSPLPTPIPPVLPDTSPRLGEKKSPERGLRALTWWGF
jgi:hypothetical protein